jgi:16S rRNA (cytosine1402-N4)-methyltransferase
MLSHTVHVPVLPNEILELGNPQPGQTWIDGTAGGGGHARLIAQRLQSHGKLLAIDRDPAVAERLHQQMGPNCLVRHASYDQAPELIKELGWPNVDGILLDLGLSSDQLADRERGFSFQTDGPLDMRFDPSAGEPAWEWLARVDETTLADMIFRYGEERYSRRIARRIVETRRAEPVRTANQLRELIYRSVPHSRGNPRRGGSHARHGRIDPATRTFQALRIVVNEELSILERALQRLPDCLSEGGALMIISFHSLEDRLVKYAFRNDERLQIITKRPVQAGDVEVAENSRSRSAKLRVARRRCEQPQVSAFQ